MTLIDHKAFVSGITSLYKALQLKRGTLLQMDQAHSSGEIDLIHY